MALLLLPWCFAALNAAVAWVAPGRTAFREHTLFGVQSPVGQPPLAAGALWSGAFQHGFAEHFDQTLPLLATAVGLKNQVYFSLLHQSGIPGVVVGKHLQLFEPIYIAEYCGRDTAAIMATADRWASDLAALQRWYAARGKVFVYLITPSKAATYPQYIGDDSRCRQRTGDRDGLLPAWDATLDRHGVRYVDAATLVRRAKPAYPFDMFPRGGTHWNEVAAALATQAVVQAVDAAPAAYKLPPFTFTWRRVRPFDVASDLTDLMNLPFPRLDYRVPAVTVQADGAAGPCHPPRIGVVGGSFTYEVLWQLMKLPCPPTADFYPYFRASHAAYPGDIRGDVDPAQRDDVLLNRADIVLLEENESLVMRTQHGPALFDLVAP